MVVAAAPDGAAQLQMQEHAIGAPRSRLYCSNRYSGRFLHWGKTCGRPAPPRAKRPGEKVSRPPKARPAAKPK